jgi:hypothetical protein
MLGVPARHLDNPPATGARGARRLVWPVRGAHDLRRVTAGCGLRRVRDVAAAGSGPRRCAIALEAAGQAAPPPAVRVPVTRGAAAVLPCSFTHSVQVPRILRKIGRSLSGLAHRRCALD